MLTYISEKGTVSESNRTAFAPPAVFLRPWYRIRGIDGRRKAEEGPNGFTKKGYNTACYSLIVVLTAC
jgi:hypothetical protein